jgi:hypothetical protein
VDWKLALTFKRQSFESVRAVGIFLEDCLRILSGGRTDL